jgi:phosphohistidine phosphatase
MIVYFIRHGLAGDYTRWQDDDRLRPLTEKGKIQMAKEAVVISELIQDLDAIITSPLVRAMQTAEIITKHLKMNQSLVEDPRLAPGFGFEELAEIVKERPEAEGLILVGHEPDFSETISRLVGGGRLVCKKGSLARVDITNLDPLQGELVWLIPPRVLIR